MLLERVSRFCNVASTTMQDISPSTNMMRTKTANLIIKTTLVLLVLSNMLYVSTSCSNSPAPASTTQGALTALQQYKYMNARLYGQMTFDIDGEQFTWPAELIIASVPLEWMGQVFNGTLKAGASGNDLTDKIHGSVSADGAWLLSLSFSRQIVRIGENGTYYRVTLKNVPIGANSYVTAPGVFEKVGDIQKYVEEIQYIDGRWDGSKIIPNVNYISTNWVNTRSGLQPILKLTFEQEPSQTMGESSIPSGMMGP